MTRLLVQQWLFWERPVVYRWNVKPFTVGVLKLAELPMFSGWGLRTIIYIFILIAAITSVMLYARTVKRDMSKSLVYELEQVESHENSVIEQHALQNDKQLV